MTLLATISNFALQILAQAEGGGAPAAPAGQSGGGGFFANNSMILWMVLLFGGMYFLMIAPQRKKQKAMQKLISELDTGDEIMLTSGIFGVVTNRKEDRFVVRIAEGVKIEVVKGAVQSVIKKSGEAVKS